MKILIIGSGGREHAILKQVSQSNKVSKVFCAPGNAGMADLAECVHIPPQNIDMLVGFAKKNDVDLVIVGPELPLTLGIVDAFEQAHIKIFGPYKNASILEGSKIFTKEFCQRHKIPTPDFKIFTDSSNAKKYVKEKSHYPIVIKADGLAAGKGVIIAKNFKQAEQAINDMMLYEKFGTAGRKILVEDFIQGEEASFIVISDGKYFVEFPTSQDHKPIFDGDQGPNTGGMGAYAPAPIVTPEMRQKVIDRIIQPTLDGMVAEDMPYTGFLYAGLMIQNGEPQLLEYNCRLGDPEAEVLLPLLKSDLVELIEHAVEGSLSTYQPQFEKGSCVSVVMASGGYPGEYEKGFEIKGLDQITDPDVFVYHAGTKMSGGSFINYGGRVLVVSAKGDSLKAAIDKVYKNVGKISWDGVSYRKDIGAKGLKFK